MIPRRRRDLLYEVLGSKSSGRARDPQSGGDENVNAAAGAIVAVGLLVALVLGGYYWSSRSGEKQSGAPALSAERSDETPAVGADRPTPPARREAGSDAGAPAPRAASNASNYAVLVRTIRWDAPAKQKEAVEEAERLVRWLDELKLPNVRAVRTPGKNEYEVYVGAAERRGDLDALETKVKQLTYKKRAYYLKDARITNRPLDSGAARNQK